MRSAIAVVLVLSVAGAANAGMYITEYMYKGNGGEFVEFTNLGPAPIDMTGWSFDDDSRLPGVLDLSSFGIVDPGESVVISEYAAGDFRNDWGLGAGVKIIGEYTNNLGRNDEINLYNASDALVDRLTFGDQNFSGSIRTENVSGNPKTPAALGANDIYQWELSSVGDVQGSWTSTSGDLGNPGTYFPEPASLVLLAIGALGLIRRRGC